MRIIEILSTILSIFGIYSLVHHVPFLLPRNLIPHVAALLTEVQGLIDRAEANGAITDASKYRADLTSLVNQLLRMRTESQRSPGIFQQIVLAVRYGLTYKLYTLSSQVDDMKVKVELALDERQLASLTVTSTQGTGTTTALPTPANTTTVKRVAESTRSPPDATS